MQQMTISEITAALQKNTPEGFYIQYAGNLNVPTEKIVLEGVTFLPPFYQYNFGKDGKNLTLGVASADGKIFVQEDPFRSQYSPIKLLTTKPDKAFFKKVGKVWAEKYNTFAQIKIDELLAAVPTGFSINIKERSDFDSIEWGKDPDGVPYDLNNPCGVADLVQNSTGKKAEFAYEWTVPDKSLNINFIFGKNYRGLGMPLRKGLKTLSELMDNKLTDVKSAPKVQQLKENKIYNDSTSEAFTISELAELQALPLPANCSAKFLKSSMSVYYNYPNSAKLAGRKGFGQKILIATLNKRKSDKWKENIIFVESYLIVRTSTKDVLNSENRKDWHLDYSSSEHGFSTDSFLKTIKYGLKNVPKIADFVQIPKQTLRTGNEDKAVKKQINEAQRAKRDKIKSTLGKSGTRKKTGFAAGGNTVNSTATALTYLEKRKYIGTAPTAQTKKYINALADELSLQYFAATKNDNYNSPEALSLSRKRDLIENFNDYLRSAEYQKALSKNDASKSVKMTDKTKKSGFTAKGRAKRADIDSQIESVEFVEPPQESGGRMERMERRKAVKAGQADKRTDIKNILAKGRTKRGENGADLADNAEMIETPAKMAKARKARAAGLVRGAYKESVKRIMQKIRTREKAIDILKNEIKALQ